MYKRASGFTIVELLIVVVVIAILAAITIVSYNGIQQRALDTQRLAAMRSVEGALKLYHVDNGSYPNICYNGDGTTKNSAGTGQHCEIHHLSAALVPKYVSSIPNFSSLPEHKRVYYASGHVSHGAQATMYAMAYSVGAGPGLSFECRIASSGLAPGDYGYSHFSPSGTAIKSCY